MELHRYLHERAARSAERIVPLLMEQVRPGSVLDVGCGLGAWLATFRELGVSDVVGVDVPEARAAGLAIPRDRFVPWDLTEPLRLEREFDLALCLEVAEHLPAPAADVLVSSLARHAPVVAFSAAVPDQGGDGHLNEQWPDYWARRFASRGFGCLDLVRPRIWADPEVQWWYAQNTVLYVKEGTSLLRDVEAGSGRGEVSPPARRVHPMNLGTRWALADWARERKRIARALEGTTPHGAILTIPEAARLDLDVEGRRTVPLHERDGTDWGVPADSDEALRALRSRIDSGTTHLAFPWPTFWWLEHFGPFLQHVRTHSGCLREDEVAVVFDLTRPAP